MTGAGIRRTLRFIAAFLGYTILALSLFELNSLRPHRDKSKSFAQSTIRCAILTDHQDSQGKVLLSGYNYTLLKYFAEDMISSYEIQIADEVCSWADSLRNGVIDILVVPVSCDTVPLKGLTGSIEADGLSTWYTASGNSTGLGEVNRWLSLYKESPSYHLLHNLYVHNFANPYKTEDGYIRTKRLSPYDGLFKVFSKRLDWDWRLLAALAYTESKFHIEVESDKGAIGIMQIIPEREDKYTMEELLEPECNIRIGVDYLKRLKQFFTSYVPEGSQDLDMFVLAAYNAGEGNIQKCIRYAESKHVYDSTWASVCSVFPEMGELIVNESDTLRLKKFNVRQTSAYVDKVVQMYNTFLESCP